MKQETNIKRPKMRREGFPGGASLFSCIYQALIASLILLSRDSKIEISSRKALKTLIDKNQKNPMPLDT